MIGASIVIGCILDTPVVIGYILGILGIRDGILDTSFIKSCILGTLVITDRISCSPVYPGHILGTIVIADRILDTADIPVTAFSIPHTAFYCK